VAKKQAAPKAPPPPALAEIEVSSKELADAKAKLARSVQTLKDAIKKVTDRHVDDLRTLGADVGVAYQALIDLVTKHPELFAKPRSQAFHGITVGYRKGKGKLTYDDAEKVIARIERQLPDQLDALAPASRQLSHDAIEVLDAKQLKAIGVSITDTDDKPYVKTPSDDVDKFVNQIVTAYSEPQKEQAA